MKAVLLAGGQGTRLREETEFRPKPMVEIGGKPILWHIMKNLSTQKLNEFIVCLGYKGDYIRDYFLNYGVRNSDVTLTVGSASTVLNQTQTSEDLWKVTLAETGPLTPTGGRLFRVRDYVGKNAFLCTYGDGLADIDLESLFDFHKRHGKTATVTAVRPPSRFGALKIKSEGQVVSFREKPKMQHEINGGFFVFEKEIFDYLNEESILEKEPLEQLAKDGELFAYKHQGFWQPMDTFRESQELNSLWFENKAPWKTWE